MCNGNLGPSSFVILELEGRLGVTGTFEEIFLTFLSRKIRSLTDSGLLGLVEEFLDDLVALVSFDGNEEDRVEFEDDLDDLKMFCRNGIFMERGCATLFH